MTRPVTDPAYAQLTRELAVDDIRCQFQSRGQLVISMQVGTVWPDRGNSFWVTHSRNRWYLFTWAPRGYSLPESAHIAELCRAFMASNERAAFTVSDAIIAKFGLTELSEEETAAICREMPAE
jgi:hypothetical protein